MFYLGFCYLQANMTLFPIILLVYTINSKYYTTGEGFRGNVQLHYKV